MKKGPEDAYMVEYMFEKNYSMEEIKLGSTEVPFAIGTTLHANKNPDKWETVTYPYTEAAVNNGKLDASYKDTTSCRNLSLIYYSAFLNDCSSLKELDLDHFQVQGYKTVKGTQTSVDNYYGTISLQYAYFLQNCSSLEHIYHLENIFNINTARITKINGVEREPVVSNTTYHVASSVVAKILKVNERGEPITGAKLQLQDAEGNPITLKVDGVEQGENYFISGETTSFFDVAPDTEYKLVELETPSNDYLPADPITFTVDKDGFHHIGSDVDEQVVMTDRDAFHIIFHENQPVSEGEEYTDVVYKTYGPADLNENGTISHFYDLLTFAGDEYVFKGWYYASGWSLTDNPDADAGTAVNFNSDTFSKSEGAEPKDYHIYAKWIPVTDVTKSADDKNNYGSAPIRGFGIAGVQIRDPGFGDPNYQNKEKPQGMRFITSLSEELFDAVNDLSASGVEYGYVVGTEENINAFVKQYGVKDMTKYKLQYNGFNVNGVNTNAKDDTGADLAADDRNADNDFRYVTNVNCTSRYNGNSSGIVDLDHENFTDYRLYTLVITYDSEPEFKSKKIDARAYIRYTDGNGMMRVFYNDYRKNMCFGGCLCSFNQVSELAIPKSTQQASEQQSGNS